MSSSRTAPSPICNRLAFTRFSGFIPSHRATDWTRSSLFGCAAAYPSCRRHTACPAGWNRNGIGSCFLGALFALVLDRSSVPVSSTSRDITSRASSVMLDAPRGPCVVAALAVWASTITAASVSNATSSSSDMTTPMSSFEFPEALPAILRRWFTMIKSGISVLQTLRNSAYISVVCNPWGGAATTNPPPRPGTNRNLFWSVSSR